MPTRREKILLLFYVFLFIGTCKSYCQEIRTTLEKVDSLNISESDMVVYDINGEICSLLILNTDQRGIKFYSNLGIEKVEFRNNVYNVWLPDQASSLKFVIPGFPLYEYSLPHFDNKYSVITILVEIAGTQKVIIQDTAKPVLAITTTPVNAKVYLNGRYIGIAPQVISDPDFSSFAYVVKKKSYKKVSSKDTMDFKSKMITVDLADLTKAKRYYVLFNFKGDRSYKSPKYIDTFHWMPALAFGVLGKTGYYGSFSYLKVNDDLSDNVGLSYYYKYNQSKKASLSFGINQQIGKRIFLYGGPGYTLRTFGQPGGDDLKSDSFDFSLGMFVRVGWYYLLQIEYSKSLYGSFSSVGLGFGVNIAKRDKV